MNKVDADSIFDRLAALGIARVSAEYSGSGDSGQFDGFIAYGPYANGQEPYIDNAVLEKPIGETDALQVVANVKARLDGEPFQTFAKELEQLAWDTVDAAGHSGFWNNDGGYGKLVFDVTERTIVLEHSNYTGATEDSTHEVFADDPNNSVDFPSTENTERDAATTP